MGSGIKFDTAIPNCREGVFVPVSFAGPEEIVKMAVRAEALGYHAVWATDFISATPDYPMPKEATPPDWYEPLLSLAACAMRTERLKLGVGVVLVPYREPVILAKQVATLDRFCGGRLLLGVGTGAYRQEFEAVMPRLAKAHRGRMFDEYLEVLGLLLGEGEVSFEGEYAHVRGVELFPKPVQSPVPLYFPGKTPATFARVAKWGNGLLVPLAMATDRMETLGALLEERGRSLDEIDVVAAVDLSLAETHEAAVALYLGTRAGEFALRRQPEAQALSENWVGTPDAVLERIDAAIALGITHFRLSNIAADSFDSMIQQMEMFAEEVMSRVGG